MDGQVFTQLALMIISVVGALISYYLIPYIKSKASAQDLQKLTDYVKIAVRCANQIYTPEEWEQKKSYVLAQVMSFMENELKISLTSEQINTIIEGIVNEVKKIDGK